MNAVYSTQAEAQRKQQQLYFCERKFSHVERVAGGWLVRRPRNDAEKQTCRVWRILDQVVARKREAGLLDVPNLV